MDFAVITNGTAQVQVSALDLFWGKREASPLAVGNCSGNRNSSLYLSKSWPESPCVSSLGPVPFRSVLSYLSFFLPPSFSPKWMKNKLYNKGINRTEFVTEIPQRRTMVTFSSFHTCKSSLSLVVLRKDWIWPCLLILTFFSISFLFGYVENSVGNLCTA